MASIKNLKKDLNYIFSDIIEDCYVWQLENSDKADKAEAIIDDAIASFDELVAKVNDRKVENKKAHFKGIIAELEKDVKKLYDFWGTNKRLYGVKESVGAGEIIILKHNDDIISFIRYSSTRGKTIDYLGFEVAVNYSEKYMKSIASNLVKSSVLIK